MQRLHSIPEFFPRGIRPDRDIFLTEGNQFSQWRRGEGCRNASGQASHDHRKNIAQPVNEKFPNSALSNPPFLWINQTCLPEPVHGGVEFGRAHPQLPRHDRIRPGALLEDQLG